MGGGLAVEIGRLCLGLVGGADGCARNVADVAEASAAALRSAGQAPERLFERVVAEHRGAWASAIAQSRDRSAIEAVEMALTEGLGRAFDSGGAIVPVGRVRPDAAVDTVLARLKSDVTRRAL